MPLSVDVPIEIIGALPLGEFLDSQFYYLLHCYMTFGLYKYTKNVGKRETNEKQFLGKKEKQCVYYENVCAKVMFCVMCCICDDYGIILGCLWQLVGWGWRGIL